MNSGPPIIFDILLLVLAVGLPLAGLAWLIFRRCKFSIGQLLFSVIIYGVVLSVAPFTKEDLERLANALKELL